MKGRTSISATASRFNPSGQWSPAVQRVVGRARQAARDTAGVIRIGHSFDHHRDLLSGADLQDVRMTDLLTDGRVARQARRRARSLGLSRTIDDTAAWAALGALAALLRIADDGSRRAVVLDAAGERSTFSRWATQAGYAPLAYDVMRPDVVGTSVAEGSVDLVVRLHPHSTPAHQVDEHLTRASWALRRGGLICITLRLGPDDEQAVSVADVRSVIARAAGRGLSLVGDLDIHDGRRAREAQQQEPGAFGLALLAFRKNNTQ